MTQIEGSRVKKNSKILPLVNGLLGLMFKRFTIVDFYIIIS